MISLIIKQNTKLGLNSLITIWFDNWQEKISKNLISQFYGMRKCAKGRIFLMFHKKCQKILNK